MFRIILLFYWIIGCQTYLNRTEIKITHKVIEELDIDYCIVAQTFEVNNVTDVGHLKTLMFEWNIPVSFYSLDRVRERVINESFFNVLTIFVFKVDELSTILDFLLLLKSVRKLPLVRNFSWLVFVNWRDEVKAVEEMLPIPLDCEFMVVHPNNETSYKLVEIYKLRNKTVTYEYGIYDENYGLTATKVSMYRRRNRVNGTEFLFETEDKDIMKCKTIRLCAQNQVLLDIANMSEFKVVPATKIELKEIYKQEEGDAFNNQSYFHPNFVKYNQLAPLFRIVVNWYIEDPINAKSADYFIKVFHPYLWLSILFTIVLGGISFAGIRSALKKFTNERIYALIDGALIVYDYFCDQDTVADDDSISFKMATLAYRIVTIIVVPAYSATITAYLAVRIPKIPFKDLKSFVANGQYLIGTLPDRYTYKYLKKTKDPFLQNLFKKFVVPANETVGIKRLCNENFAFLAPHKDIYEFKDIAECNFHEIEEPITYVDNAIDLGSDTPYRSLLRHNLINIYSSGIYRKMLKELEGDVTMPEKKNFSSIGIDQLVLVFCIVLIGVALGIIVFLIEWSVKNISEIKKRLFRKGKKKKKNHDRPSDWMYDIHNEGCTSDVIRVNYVRKRSIMERFSVGERKYSIVNHDWQ